MNFIKSDLNIDAHTIPILLFLQYKEKALWEDCSNNSQRTDNNNLLLYMPVLTTFLKSEYSSKWNTCKEVYIYANT
jgi:hypothetical protein